MPRTPFTLRCRILLAFLAATPGGSADASEPLSAAGRVREQMLRMTDFLDTKLPGVLEEKNITLHFRPKFGDLRDEEYMRFPFEVRYGLTNRTELQAGLVPFIPSPFNSGRDHRWGPGEAKLGARYDLRHAFKFFRETTVGLETRIPLGKPPTEINDHYTHVKPFVSLARELSRWRATTVYTNVSYDRSVKLTRRDPPPPEVMRRHVLTVAPGVLYKPGELGYFTEYRFRHINEPGETRLGHEVLVGTVWDIPLARTERWRLPGKWQLEIALRGDHEEGRGSGQGVFARVNWRTTLREMLEHTRVSGFK
jgi:hypothetical protein